MDNSDREDFVRASWVNVAGNAAKVVVEGAVGFLFGSLALVADAAHSVADLVASVVVLVYGGASYNEADATHPHGHGRLEPLAALFVGGVIGLLGLTLLYESATEVVRGPGVDVEGWRVMVAALGFAVVSMYALYRYTVRVNARVGSTALDALARDCMNDVYTSVAASIGIVGVGLGHPILDPFAGGLVSVIVVYQGVEIGHENVGYLVGSAPTEAKQDEILEAALSHPEVRGTHDFKAFYDGTEIEVETHAEVDGEHTVYEAHDIESEVVDRVREVEGVGDVHVHLDPAGIGEWADEDE
jgi:cation diffusion facilitator family transporter